VSVIGLAGGRRSVLLAASRGNRPSCRRSNPLVDTHWRNPLSDTRTAPASRILAAMLSLAAAGCSGLVAGPGEPDISAIKPGMTQQEVRNRLGPPHWTFGVRQENLRILNYRFSHSDCTIYQVSVRPDGTVRDAGSAWDPACDGPSRD